jgi:hypothetical protein
MYIKDKTFKIVNRCYIVFNILLWIMMIYLMIDSMVSLKYETEKEAINLHTNLASDYIKQTIQIISLFLAYITLNIIYSGIMGRKLKNPK